MGREKKPYCIKKKGDYYYYKLPSMKNYKSTELKSETKAEKYVLDLIKQIDKDNGVIIDTDKTFVSYTKDYFIWNKCPYFTRRMRQGRFHQSQLETIRQLNSRINELEEQNKVLQDSLKYLTELLNIKNEELKKS